MAALPDLTPLVGCVVGRLDLDYRVTLNLASQDSPYYGERVDAVLVIGSTFEITRASERYEVNPDGGAGYRQVLPLLHSIVVEVEVGPDESLHVESSGNQSVHVPRSRNFEAWEISGNGVPGWLAGPY